MASSGMQSKTQVIIDFTLQDKDVIKNLQEITVKIQNLKQTLAGMKAAGQENSAMYHQLSAALKELEGTAKANQKALLESIKQQKDNGDSINALRAKLKLARQEFEDLSRAERESAQGNDLLNHIKELTDELNTLEQAQGDWSRQVGHYQKAVENLPVSKAVNFFKTLSNGTMNAGVAFKNGIGIIKNFAKQLWALVKIPIVALISAIVMVAMKLVDSFKKSDTAMTALHRVFAAFEPILGAINKAFDYLVNVLAKVVNGIADFAQKVVSAIPGMKDYVQAADDMVAANERLEDSEREYETNHSDRQNKIAKLRGESAEKDKHTYKEREKMLQEAIDLEKEDMKERRKIAVEQYNLAVKKLKQEKHVKVITKEIWDSLSEDRKNEINRLNNAITDLDTEFYNSTRRLRGEMSSFRQQEKSEREQAAKQAAQIAKERANNELSAQQGLEDAFINSLQNMYDKEYSITALSYQRDIDALKKKLKEEKNLTAKARADIERTITLKESDMAVALSEMRERQEKETNDKMLEMRRKTAEMMSKLAGAKNDYELKMKFDLELNEFATNKLKNGLKAELEEAQKAIDAVKKDLESMSESDIATKYGETFVRRGISTAEGYHKALAELQSQYGNEMEDMQEEIDRQLETIDEQHAIEEKRIWGENTRAQMGEEQKRFDAARKHKELMQKLQLEENYDPYAQNQAEMTQIALQQANERYEIAKTEYDRIASLRAEKSDDELAAIYGSVEEYDNKVLEANLKVVESFNDVKDAERGVLEANLAVKKDMINTAATIMNAMNQVMGSIQGVFETLAESDDKYADYATAMALMQILVSTAVSIAQAIASGMQVGGAAGPGALVLTPVAIAELVAVVLSGMASATATLLKAKQAKQSAPKFSEGGLVGNKTTRRKDDTVDAKLSLGEYVIPSEVVKEKGVRFFDELIGNKTTSFTLPKLSFADGGLVSTLTTPNFEASSNGFNMEELREVMRESMSEAVEGITPVVSVKEITNVQNRVQTKERIARQ